MTPLRQIGRRKNLPRVGFTHGEWAGVKALERVKSKRIAPPSIRRLRNSKSKWRPTRALKALQG
jgi:hypothetical protein